MIEWKDATSYSKGDRERVPNAWHAEVSRITISVHKHIDYGEEWLLSCQEFDVRCYALGEDLERAKEKALLYVIGSIEAKTMQYEIAYKLIRPELK